MTETVKKAKPAAKPRKTTTTSKKKAAPANADPIAISNREASENHNNTNHQPTIPHEEVARLAHKYWKERGHKHGHHEEDWYRAERELAGVAS
jgi:hypothetical protein